MARVDLDSLTETERRDELRFRTVLMNLQRAWKKNDLPPTLTPEECAIIWSDY